MQVIEPNELEALLRDLESDRVERKESLGDGDKIRKTICALANDLPGRNKWGVIFVGVKDDGACSNLLIDDRLLLTLAGMRDDGSILPFPSVTVEKMSLSGCELAVVVVYPAAAPPVRYRGRIGVRVGPRLTVASSHEEVVLAERRRSRDLPFDVSEVPSASVADLDLDLFSHSYLPALIAPDTLSENQRSVEAQLKSARFLSPSGQPTVNAILTVGKEPRRFLPGAYIQFVRFDGAELSDPIRDQKELDGPLVEMMEKLDDTLQVNNSVSSEITAGSLEIRRPQYPMAALQQLTRNAILHRLYEATNAPVRIYWFEDRIEIHSPGGPFGQVNRENFGQPGVTDYRNPNLAEALKTLGYVQRFGVGIEVARRELASNGNPPPEFDVQPSNVLALVRRLR